jgi:hypothetical protein
VTRSQTRRWVQCRNSSVCRSLSPCVMLLSAYLHIHTCIRAFFTHADRAEELDDLDGEMFRELSMEWKVLSDQDQKKTDEDAERAWRAYGDSRDEPEDDTPASLIAEAPLVRNAVSSSPSPLSSSSSASASASLFTSAASDAKRLEDTVFLEKEAKEGPPPSAVKALASAPSTHTHTHTHLAQESKHTHSHATAHPQHPRGLSGVSGNGKRHPTTGGSADGGGLDMNFSIGNSGIRKRKAVRVCVCVCVGCLSLYALYVCE